MQLPKAKILMLEDSLPDANLMKIELEEAEIPVDALQVETREEFLAAIEQFAPQLILADYYLPAFDGLQALSLARKSCPDTPFVIVTGALGEERAAECMKKGATDFLLKDNLSRLPQVVLRALREGREKHERKQAELARNRLIEILEATTDFVGITNLQGQWVYINQAGRRLKGMSRSDKPDSLRLEDFFPAHIVELMRTEAMPGAAAWGMWTDETVILDQQGEEVPVSQLILAHKGADGEVEYFSNIVRDITTLKAAEDRTIQAIVNAEDRERKRISREIHDGLGQTLSAAKLNLEAVRSEVKKLDRPSQVCFQQALSLIQAAISESREISHNLMPQIVEDFGLIPALQNLCGKMVQTTELEVVFYHNLPECRLNNELELNVYRIVQEALTNVMRHARASRMSVQLIAYPDKLILTLEDNGTGFDVSRARKEETGMGLRNIRNRAVAIGGKLVVESAPRQGTSIILELDLPEELA